MLQEPAEAISSTQTDDRTQTPSFKRQLHSFIPKCMQSPHRILGWGQQKMSGLVTTQVTEKKTCSLQERGIDLMIMQEGEAFERSRLYLCERGNDNISYKGVSTQ